MSEASSAASSGSVESALAAEFLRVSRREIKNRLNRIEGSVARLSPEQIWERNHDVENSVGNLMLHLAGNVRQWIVCGVGGAADDRDRDAEFSRREPLPADELLSRLRAAVEEADRVLAALAPEQLAEKRKIQIYEVTVLHAIYHVVDHFAEHTGQIIWATKRMTGEDLGFYSYLKGESAGAGEKREP